MSLLHVLLLIMYLINRSGTWSQVPRMGRMGVAGGGAGLHWLAAPIMGGTVQVQVRCSGAVRLRPGHHTSCSSRCCPQRQPTRLCDGSAAALWLVVRHAFVLHHHRAGGAGWL